MNFLDRKAYDWGSAFARALFWLFPKRRRIAVDNILKAKIIQKAASTEKPQLREV